MRTMFKRAVLKGLDASGLTRVRANRGNGRLAVLMLHRVLPPDRLRTTCSSEHIVVSTDVFRALLNEWLAWGEPIGLGDLALPPPKKRCFLVTFDDGWSDTAEFAHPILCERSIPYAVFLPTARIGKPEAFWQERVRHFCFTSLIGNRAALSALPEWSTRDAAKVRESRASRPAIHAWIEALKRRAPQERDALLAVLDHLTREQPFPVETHRLMHWDEVRALHAVGVSFGSHGRTHRLLTQLAADALRRELAESRDELARRLGAQPLAVAYPNGACNQAVKAAAVEAGYAWGLVTQEGVADRRVDPMRLPRLNVSEQRFTDARGVFDPRRLAWALAWGR